MTWLYAGMVLLAVMAAVLLWIPLNRGARKLRDKLSGSARAQRNLLLYQERLAELQLEADQGLVDPATFESLQTELAAQLLGDVDPDQLEADKVDVTPPSSRYALPVLLVCIVLLLPLGSFFLYLKLGHASEMAIALNVQQTRDVVANAESLEDMIAQLQEQVDAQPENLEARFLLARGYMSAQNFDQAAVTLQELAAALTELGQDPSPAMGMRAQALFLRDDALTPPVQEAVEQTLDINPNETQALSILGVAAFQVGAYEAAIGAWRKVLEVDPEYSDAEALQAGIRRAETLLAEQSAAEGAPAGSEAAPESLARVKVSVSLAPEMLERVSPGDSVFVLARPVDGSRMPLAVLRTTAGALPLTVSLDESMAMGPMGSLSEHPEVQVVARVSFSGQALPAPGDLEGLAGPVPVGNEDPAAVVIDQEI